MIKAEAAGRNRTNTKMIGLRLTLLAVSVSAVLAGGLTYLVAPLRLPRIEVPQKLPATLQLRGPELMALTIVYSARRTNKELPAGC